MTAYLANQMPHLLIYVIKTLHLQSTEIKPLIRTSCQKLLQDTRVKGTFYWDTLVVLLYVIIECLICSDSFHPDDSMEFFQTISRIKIHYNKWNIHDSTTYIITRHVNLSGCMNVSFPSEIFTSWQLVFSGSYWPFRLTSNLCALIIDAKFTLNTHRISLAILGSN